LKHLTLNIRTLLAIAILIHSISGAAQLQISEAPKKPLHHAEEGFRNVHIGEISKGPFGYLKAKYFGDEPFADHEQQAHLMDVVTPGYDALLAPTALPQVTWLGHSTFLIQHNGINILTDPMLSERASPVSFAGPKRLVPKPISFEHLPRIDFIVISHNHYDHLDLETLEKLPKDIHILVPLKLGTWLAHQGFSKDRLTELDWWQSASSSKVSITALPSQHWSARGLFDRNETLWASWMLDIGELRVWFGGDTGYNPVEFKEIGKAFRDIDLALIPIGAYAPRWFMRQQHVDPYEAILMHHDLAAKRSIGMHWGTFQLSAEPMFEPKHLLQKAVLEGKIKPGLFDTMAIGETRLIEDALY